MQAEVNKWQDLAGKVGGKMRLDALDMADSASATFEEGLAAGGLVVARFRHFANWFEQVDNFADYWNNRGSRLKSTVSAPRAKRDAERNGEDATIERDLARRRQVQGLFRDHHAICRRHLHRPRRQGSAR